MDHIKGPLFKTIQIGPSKANWSFINHYLYQNKAEVTSDLLDELDKALCDWPVLLRSMKYLPRSTDYDEDIFDPPWLKELSEHQFMVLARTLHTNRKGLLYVQEQPESFASITCLQLRDLPLPFTELSKALNVLTNLNTLYLEDIALGGKKLKRLLKIPALSSIRSLILKSCALTDSDVVELAQTSSLRLTHLDVSENALRGESLLNIFSSSSCLKNLISLDVSYNLIEAVDLRELMGGYAFNTLNHLDLSFNKLGHKIGYATDLAASGILENLTYLNLAYNDFGIYDDDDLLNFVHAKSLSKLLHLDISGNLVDSSDDSLLREVIQSKYLQGLHSLSLYEMYIGHRGLEMLFNTDNLPQLKNLAIELFPDNFSDVKFKSDSRLLHLSRLNLGLGFITVNRIRDLAFSPLLERVTELDLRYLYLKNHHLMVLLNSPFLKQLTSLIINSNEVDNDGLRIIASAPTLSKLHTLTFRGSHIGNIGSRILASSSTLPVAIRTLFQSNP